MGRLLSLGVFFPRRIIPLTISARPLGFLAPPCTAMSERQRGHQIDPNNYTEMAHRILGFTPLSETQYCVGFCNLRSVCARARLTHRCSHSLQVCTLRLREPTRPRSHLEYRQLPLPELRGGYRVHSRPRHSRCFPPPEIIISLAL